MKRQKEATPKRGGKEKSTQEEESLKTIKIRIATKHTTTGKQAAKPIAVINAVIEALKKRNNNIALAGITDQLDEGTRHTYLKSVWSKKEKENTTRQRKWFIVLQYKLL